MYERVAKLAVALTALSVGVTFSSVPAFGAGPTAAPPPYTNHTVGDAAGWFFNDATNSSATNYSSWATSQSFNLGDYLIFNTNTNMTVVQTYNETTYGLCSADEDYGNETFVYTDDGNDGFGVPVVAAVPLTLTGLNYFFSDAGDDGVQCLHGMRFHITVAYGQGLPPDLSQPPPPPYAVPPPPAAPSTGSPGASSPGRANGGARGSGGRAGVGILRLLLLAVFGAVVVLVV